MLRKPRKAEQAIEPREEVQARKSRFQIVKLEERIAPHLNGKGICPRGHRRGYYCV